MTDEPRTLLVCKLWNSIQARDWHEVADLLHPGLLVEWPHTRERIVGPSNFIAINRNYPEPWDIELHRTTAGQDGRVFSEIAVKHPGGISFCCSVFEFLDNRIWRVTEYWADDDHEAPEWRSRWVEKF